jgi:hypothetical protein
MQIVAALVDEAQIAVPAQVVQHEPQALQFGASGRLCRRVDLTHQA